MEQQVELDPRLEAVVREAGGRHALRQMDEKAGKFRFMEAHKRVGT